MAQDDQHVLIVGAGPVGLVAAISLLQHGIPVTVLEASSDLAVDLRASTFHPPTLDYLDRLDLTDGLIERGIKCPLWQFRDRKEGEIATFDLGLLKDETAHPYRLQCEQWKLIEAARARLEARQRGPQGPRGRRLGDGGVARSGQGGAQGLPPRLGPPG